jgi:cytochrome c oxidase subunit 2
MSNSPKENGGVDRIEKRVFLTAILVTCLGLGLIAYAAWGMGIAVPDCVPNSKIFEHGSVVKHGEKTYEVHFLASMWQFEPSRVTVPVGSTLDLFVISKDVVHGFNILGTNVNLMVEPAVVNEARVHFERPGIYPIICHEYCGVGHQAMNAVIEVSATASDISVEGLPSSGTSTLAAGSIAPVASLPGSAIMDQKGCLACHSVDGTDGVGPTFKGLWGSKVEFTDGTTRTADEEYVEEMIQFPGKKIVKGFSPIMPKVPMTHEEIEQVIGYLKALK